MSPLVASIAGVAASALAGVIRIVGPAARAWFRLWRLASLRARGARAPVTTQFDGPVRTAGRVRLLLGERCRLGHGVFFETSGPGSITLGRDVRVNQGTLIVSHTRVEIGDDVLIGEHVSIRDADHGTALTDPPVPIRAQPHAAAPVRIGRGAWIARGACILKGVSIGEGAVVAANAVVTRDVPPRAIVGGVPARVLKLRTPDQPISVAAEDSRAHA